METAKTSKERQYQLTRLEIQLSERFVAEKSCQISFLAYEWHFQILRLPPTPCQNTSIEAASANDLLVVQSEGKESDRMSGSDAGDRTSVNRQYSSDADRSQRPDDGILIKVCETATYSFTTVMLHPAGLHRPVPSILDS